MDCLRDSGLSSALISGVLVRGNSVTDPTLSRVPGPQGGRVWVTTGVGGVGCGVVLVSSIREK